MSSFARNMISHISLHCHLSDWFWYNFILEINTNFCCYIHPPSSRKMCELLPQPLQMLQRDKKVSWAYLKSVHTTYQKLPWLLQKSTDSSQQRWHSLNHLTTKSTKEKWHLYTPELPFNTNWLFVLMRSHLYINHPQPNVSS